MILNLSANGISFLTGLLIIASSILTIVGTIGFSTFFVGFSLFTGSGSMISGLAGTVKSLTEVPLCTKENEEVEDIDSQSYADIYYKEVSKACKKLQ
jgi:hypothetical protein